MELLHRQHSIWKPDDHLAVLNGKEWDGAKCPVVVTVDDGYSDFHSVAFPIFRDLKIPAILFVTTGFVDGNTWLWWDKLRYILHSAGNCQLQLELAGEQFDVDLSCAERCEATWNRIADRCRFVPNETKETILDQLAEKLDVTVPFSPVSTCRALTWDQIRLMQKSGILFGAHSVHHPILSRLSAIEAAEEITNSKHRLAEKVETEIDWFCYPQGGPADYTNDIKDQLRAAGFKGCYIAFQDLENTPDVYAISRYGITADLDDFRWVMCGAEYLGNRIRHWLGRPTGPGPSYWNGKH